MSDGLTVPFALAAGLSGAISSTNIIVTAGLAEIAAGGIAMGLGGYLAAKTESEHYASDDNANLALKISALFTLLALFGFGYIKGRFTGAKPLNSAIQTAAIGGLAAIAAFSIAQIFH